MPYTRGARVLIAFRDWTKPIRLVVVGVACVVGFVGFGAAAALGSECPNEAFRVGPSASLPDCRAYELVTPENLGRTQDMTFDQGNDAAIPASDGENIALQTSIPLEPNPALSASIIGARAVFSRTLTGWEMKSMVADGMSRDHLNVRLLNPELSQVALQSETLLNEVEFSPDQAFEVGPVGGPYKLVANVPNSGGYEAAFLGANAGTDGVPAFSDVLFWTSYHALPLLSGAEETAAKETVAGAPNLYDWNGGHLQLVNVTSKGALLNKCGALLGAGFSSNGTGTVDAVSADGSKIFFTSPAPNAAASCPESEPPRGPEPTSLFMRVDGRETVEVSPLASVAASGRRPVYYNGATPDGSEVFFTTETKLTKESAAEEEKETGIKLFMYNAVTRALTLIASGLSTGDVSEGVTPAVVVSEDGSTVYYETLVPEGGAALNISRYDTRTGGITHVATIADEGKAERERSYVTPDGKFLLFPTSGKVNERTGALEDGVVGEPRGAGHNELYRYDAADGSVMCVSCGDGVAPAEGEMLEPGLGRGGALLATEDEMPPFIQMSDDGQEVFFQTTAQLVPQDRNTTAEEGRQGLDVYEWEAEGSEEAPGVFCREVNGCTHLLSSGEEVGPAQFLGASHDGHNVFFATAAQLVPQATPEFGNIYDARVDGGFSPPAPSVECASCQGVGNPPPLFSVPAGVSFEGAGNPVGSASTPSTATKAKKVTKCPKGRKPSHGRCVKAKSRHKQSKARRAREGRRGR
jgi:hypothetical protein